MRDHLTEFIENVDRAQTHAFDERVVRGMLERVARTCPIPALVHLGRSLIEYRKAELKSKAERN